MAIINGKYIQGALGPAVLKKQGNKQTISAKVRKGQVNQSKGTKKASKSFGTAALLVKVIRTYFSDLSNKFEDGGFNSRLMTAVSETLYTSRDDSGYTFSEFSFQGLSGLDFNINSPLLKTLRIKPIVELLGQTLTIRLPELKIPKHFMFPKKSTSCKLMVRVILLRLADTKINRYLMENSLLIESTQQMIPQENFRFDIPEGCLCLASLFLQFYHISREFKILDNDKNFNPSCILASIYKPGTFNGPENEWSMLPHFKLK